MTNVFIDVYKWQHSSRCYKPLHGNKNLISCCFNFNFPVFDCSSVTSPQFSMTLRGSDMQNGWAACWWADWNCRDVCCSSNHQDVRLYCLRLSVWLTDPSQTAAAAVGNPAPGARRMVAIFDYDPRESSPNTDIEVRLAQAFFLLFFWDKV